MTKLAIICSHPIQYYAPWFRYLAQVANLNLKVFYLWDFGITQKVDLGFQQAFQWDIPLLEGYDYQFVTNTSADPGTHHFWGLQNPTLLKQVKDYQPHAVLLMSYNYASLYQFIWYWNTHQVPLLFKGDSHRLFVSHKSILLTIKQKIIELIYKRFAAFLYVGKANYNYFSYHGVSPEKLFFAPHAVDNDWFCGEEESAKQDAKLWKQELGIPEDHLVIVFAGKFEAKKRPLDLLQAFLIANLEQTSLLFVGAGELEAEMRAQAGSHPEIRFAPFQNQSLMPRTYAIADLFVLPSYSLQETWGLAVNEAMCLSCPIIVSDHVGCAQDLVIPYHNGLIFPAGDVVALSNSLTLACSNPSRLQQWGQKSQCMISEYSYQKTTEGLIKALKYLQV